MTQTGAALPGAGPVPAAASLADVMPAAAVAIGVPWDPPPGLDLAARAQYATERQAIAAFVADLPRVRRLLAHLPVAMIFDDHDITDDWNLSREWEEIAYGHPLSRRVIGNVLVYLVSTKGGHSRLAKWWRQRRR